MKYFCEFYLKVIHLINLSVCFKTLVFGYKLMNEHFIDSSLIGIIQKDTSDEVILEPRAIAKHYLRGWFLVDIMSSIPVDYVFLVAMAFEEPGEAHSDRFV